MPQLETEQSISALFEKLDPEKYVLCPDANTRVHHETYRSSTRFDPVSVIDIQGYVEHPEPCHVQRQIDLSRSPEAIYVARR